MRVRRFWRRFAVLLATCATVSTVSFLLVYPALFPKPLAHPSFNVDPAEGKVWINSAVVLEVRGRLSEAEVIRRLAFRPSVNLDAGDVTIEHLAKLPLHESFPWATTRITINSERGKLFRPDTTYSLALDETAISFETITLPAIVSVRADQHPQGGLANVPTNSDIVILFNEEVAWDPRLLEIVPPIRAQTVAERLPNGATAMRVKPPGRWENSTAYTLTIDGAVEDVYGHTGEVTFAAEFVTWPQPKVTAAAPQGESQPLETAVQVQFERDVDRATVQESFRIEPAVSGLFDWQSDRVLIWHPHGLQHSTWYRLSIAGKAAGGDAIVPLEWSFRTQDPPVFVEIRGRAQAPAVLEAIPSGGLGSYSLQWNTGDTARKILFPGPGTQPHTVEVTVRSGDRTATTSMQVAPAPDNGFTPVGCPGGWELIEVSVCYRAEELPGPIRTFAARIDLRDPNLQTRSVPAADVLGATRPTSEDARSSGAIVAVNGDFFYSWERGSFPLGPMVWGGHFVYAPTSPEVVLALGRDHSAWTGPAAELRFAVQSTDGSSLGLQGVNHIPEEHAASVFNSYWGPELTLGIDGCVAIFAPADHSPRVADSFGCGPIASVPLPVGAFAIVARGAAADWMWAQSGNPLSVVHSFPLGDVDFMVGGSHVLLQSGTQTAISPDKRNPRTAIGVDAGGFLYLLVVDGRAEESVGMTSPELQTYLGQMGVTNGINLDGGGSSTLVLGGAVMNRPSDGRERSVASVVEVGAPRSPCGHAFVPC